MQFSPTSIRVLPAMALSFFVIAAAGGEARAGIENQETGEKCWGGDCSDMSGGGSSGNGSGNSGGSTWSLANVETYDCTGNETEKIHVAVGWLQDNLSALDEQMGRNGLMDWPGNSRENFEDKLDKQLKFYCINDKNKCEDGTLGAIVYPVVAQQRINLCTENMADHVRPVSTEQSYYVHVIAHEIGHLVRLNAHRPDCRDRYTDPRFSMAVGLAAEVAHLGVDYDADDFLGLFCPTTPMPSWEDIIEMKQEQKPPLTASKPLG
jgi:hypothetical protein